MLVTGLGLSVFGIWTINLPERLVRFSCLLVVGISLISIPQSILHSIISSLDYRFHTLVYRIRKEFHGLDGECSAYVQ